MGDFVIESFGSEFSLTKNPGPNLGDRPIPGTVPLRGPSTLFDILGLIGFTSRLVLPLVEWIEENITPKLKVILPYYMVIGQAVKSSVTVRHDRTSRHPWTVPSDRPKEHFSYYTYFGIIENYKLLKRN